LIDLRKARQRCRAFFVFGVGQPEARSALIGASWQQSRFTAARIGGAWFEFEGNKMQGRDETISIVKFDDEMRNKLESQLNEVLYSNGR
jgi:hypothetical protein